MDKELRCLWGLSPLALRSYLEWVESSQVAALYTYLGESTIQVACSSSHSIIHKLHFPSSLFFIFHSINSLCYMFLFNSISSIRSNHFVVSFLFFNFLICIIVTHILVFFSLPLWSEPSHLLNHLVKFVSNGDLLRVLTIIVLKSKSSVKCHLKMDKSKINSHQWFLQKDRLGRSLRS